MRTTERRAPVRDTDAATVHVWRLALFARMWAIAALLHLAGDARDALATSPALAVSSALLGTAGLLVLLAPYQLWRLGLLCVLVPTTAWYEAPVVGNHWALASLVSGALLVSVIVTYATGPSNRPGDVWRLFAPTARLTLLVAYSFAAFAKLNQDFLDPSVSCALYYHNQLVGSWGIRSLALSDSQAIAHAVPVVAAVTEVAVAGTLAFRRTWRVGIVLAAGFHWLLAMDLHQHFWDFSAVLFAIFAMFVDDAQIGRLRRVAARRPRRSAGVRLGGRSIVSAMVVTVVALNVIPVPAPLDGLRLLLGHLAWWSYGTGVAIVLVLLGMTRPVAPIARGGALRPPVALLYALPALAMLNGLTPYLEIKTGFGWNMYSNLRTVAGETNHLLVPGTLDITGAQSDVVRIISSSDRDLARLAADDYVLTFGEFQKFAQANAGAAVTYERNGVVHTLRRLSDDPELSKPVNAVSQRLQPFRPIDESGTERCRTVIELPR